MNTGRLPPTDGSRDQEHKSRLLFLRYRGGRDLVYRICTILSQYPPCIGFQFPPGIKCIQRCVITEETLLLKTINRSAIFTTVRSVLTPASSRWLRKLSPITVCILFSFVGTFHLLSVYEFAFQKRLVWVYSRASGRKSQ